MLQALARGHTNASAANVLGISPKTIDSHRTSLMRKFAVNSTTSMLLARYGRDCWTRPASAEAAAVSSRPEICPNVKSGDRLMVRA